MATAVLLHKVRRPLPRNLSAAIERAVAAMDEHGEFTFREHYSAGDEPKVWFDVPNMGHPFDVRMANRIQDALAKTYFQGTTILSALKAASL